MSSQLEELLISLGRRNEGNPEIREACDAVVEQLRRGETANAASAWNALVLARHDWSDEDLELARQIDLSFASHAQTGAACLPDSAQYYELRRKYNSRARAKRQASQQTSTKLKRFLAATTLIVVLTAGIAGLVASILEHASSARLTVFVVMVLTASWGLWYSLRAKPSEIDRFLEGIDWLP